MAIDVGGVVLSTDAVASFLVKFDPEGVLLFSESYDPGPSSWITDVIGHPIALIPYLRGKIDARYPGTRISISEYYYGGGDHVIGLATCPLAELLDFVMMEGNG